MGKMARSTHASINMIAQYDKDQHASLVKGHGKHRHMHCYQQYTMTWSLLFRQNSNAQWPVGFTTGVTGIAQNLDMVSAVGAAVHVHWSPRGWSHCRLRVMSSARSRRVKGSQVSVWSDGHRVQVHVHHLDGQASHMESCVQLYQYLISQGPRVSQHAFTHDRRQGFMCERYHTTVIVVIGMSNASSQR